MEEIQKSVRTCLTKYADFSGRANRPEFWWFILAQVVVSIVLGIASDLLSMLFSLGVLVPTLAAGARRLHDIGKTGWLQLLGFIPVLGWILLIYWFAQPGVAGANAYGSAPGDDIATELAPGQQ
jgi:uncharacterized membrane protein YhaH (DUF805 family)